MIDLKAFKDSIFSGNELNTTEIAVLFYIFVQDRKKFVFYKNMMMNALNIKDIRTLNHAIDSLIKKGFIQSAVKMFRNVKGFIFSIVGVDVEEQNTTNESNECSSHDSGEQVVERETLTAVSRNETSECLTADVPPRAAAGGDDVSVPVPGGQSAEVLPKRTTDIATKYSELSDVNEMSDEERDALAFLRMRFS